MSENWREALFELDIDPERRLQIIHMIQKAIVETELDRLMLTPQDLMEVRDAADILSDVDDEVAYDLGKVGDKIAELLKLMVDTP